MQKNRRDAMSAEENARERALTPYTSRDTSSGDGDPSSSASIAVQKARIAQFEQDSLLLSSPRSSAVSAVQGALAFWLGSAAPSLCGLTGFRQLHGCR